MLWSVSVTFSQKEHLFILEYHPFSAVFFLLLFTRSIISTGRLFSQSALFLLNCRSSLPVQICKKPKFLRSVGILSVSDNFIHNKYCFFSTIVLVYNFRYLGSQHTRAVLALLSVSVTFIHKEHRFYSAVTLLHQFRYVKAEIPEQG